MKEKITGKEEEILQEIINITIIPALPGNEIMRARHLQKLMYSYGINDVHIDIAGNVIGKLQGEIDDAIIICAKLDSYWTDPEIKLTRSELSGKGIAECSVPLYALAMVGDLLKSEKPKHTIYLVATVEGSSNAKGMRHFIDNLNHGIVGIINLQSSKLGAVSDTVYSFIRLRAELKEENLSSEFGKNKLIFAMANFIQRLREEEFAEGINLTIGEVNAGGTYEISPDKGNVKIEVRGIRIADLRETVKIIKGVAFGVSREERIQIDIKEEIIKEGTDFKVSIMEKLFMKAAEELDIIPSNDVSGSIEISYPIIKGYDAVSMSVVDASKMNTDNESIEIKSFYRGMEHLVEGVMKADKMQF